MREGRRMEDLCFRDEENNQLSTEQTKQANNMKEKQNTRSAAPVWER